MLRASVRCQTMCTRCEGVRGRSAAGPPSLSSTLLRYYTASIVHILHIYTYYILYIYLYIYTWTYYCLYDAEAERKQKERNKKIYIYIYIHHTYIYTSTETVYIYIYISAYIYEKEHIYLVYKVLAFFGAIFFLLSRMVLSSLLTFSSTPYY